METTSTFSSAQLFTNLSHTTKTSTYATSSTPTTLKSTTAAYKTNKCKLDLLKMYATFL